MAALELEQEEKDLLDSYERGEWRSVKNLEQEIQKHREHARKTLKKDKRVNIRVSSMVLDELQARAAEDGIPYQTLISSILHRFATGRFIEKPRQDKPREDYAHSTVQRIKKSASTSVKPTGTIRKQRHNMGRSASPSRRNDSR